MTTPIIHAVNPNTPNGFYYGFQLIKNGTGKTIDIGAAVAMVDVWESLSDMSMSGQVFLIDTSGFVTNLKVQSGDSIRVLLYNRDTQIANSVDWTGTIMSITDGQRLNSSKGRTFHVELVDKSALLNRRGSIAKYYVNTTSGIVQSIAKDFLGIDKVDAEATSPSMTIYGSQRQPYALISFILSAAVSTTHGNGQNFYFYQDPDGFHFKSFKELATTAKVWNYQLSTSSSMSADQDSNWLRVLDYHHNRQADHLEAMAGALQNELVTFNPMTRTVTHKTYDYKDKYKSTQVLGTYPIVDLENNVSDWTAPSTDQTLGTRPHVWTVPSLASPADSDKSATNQMTMFGDNFGQMTAQSQLVNQISYNLHLPGNCELRPGHIMNIDVNALSAQSSQEKDKAMNGKFMIGNIHHVMSTVETLETYVDVFSDGPQQNITQGETT